MRVLTAVLLVTTAAPAGAEVRIGGHAVGSLVMGSGDGGGGTPARGGLTVGGEVEVGSEGHGVALVVEELARKPAPYADATELSFAVEYRHRFAPRGRGRGGFIGVGGGIRTVDDDSAMFGTVTHRGYDVRLDGGVELARWSDTAMHLRFGLTYGCYTHSVTDGGERLQMMCHQTLLGQMLIGLDLSHRL